MQFITVTYKFNYVGNDICTFIRNLIARIYVFRNKNIAKSHENQEFYHGINNTMKTTGKVVKLKGIRSLTYAIKIS